MSDSNATRLLERASEETVRLTRHLLVAAALREALPHEPVVVGGTAEEFWTADEYHPTDLDLCVPVDNEVVSVLRTLGFRKSGRHWNHPGINVSVKIPDSRIDGDESRTRLHPTGAGAARIIGVDDLYIDRLRQATMNEVAEDVHFTSALAVASACYEQIDWRYIRRRMTTISKSDPRVAAWMRRLNTMIRRRAKPN